jgi:hypothetical protein
MFLTLVIMANHLVVEGNRELAILSLFHMNTNVSSPKASSPIMVRMCAFTPVTFSIHAEM